MVNYLNFECNFKCRYCFINGTVFHTEKFTTFVNKAKKNHHSSRVEYQLFL